MKLKHTKNGNVKITMTLEQALDLKSYSMDAKYTERPYRSTEHDTACEVERLFDDARLYI